MLGGWAHALRTRLQQLREQGGALSFNTGGAQSPQGPIMTISRFQARYSGHSKPQCRSSRSF